MKKNIFLYFTIIAAAGASIDRQSGIDAMQKEGSRVTQESSSELSEEYALKRESEIRARLEKLTTLSLSRTRTKDPFGAPLSGGLRQETPVKQETAQKGDVAGKKAEEDTLNFSAAIQGLDIRGVNVGRKEFLCGSDNVFEGDIIDVNGGGGAFRIWVVSVTPTGITFMDSRSRRTEVYRNNTDVPKIKTANWGARGQAKEAPSF